MTDTQGRLITEPPSSLKEISREYGTGVGGHSLTLLLAKVGVSGTGISASSVCSDSSGNFEWLVKCHKDTRLEAKSP